MAGSMLDALKKAGVVDKKKAEAVEKEKVKALRSEEYQHELVAHMHAPIDAKEEEYQKKFLNRASRETTKASSRVGTKAYTQRFVGPGGKPVPPK